ncbi:MAG: S41 family peptidase [Myxococcota bacterium]
MRWSSVLLPFLCAGCATPVVCEDTTRPHRVVDQFWSVLDRSYAVFDPRLGDQDWIALGRQACAEVTPSTSDDDLFDVLLGMAQSLDDGHIQLSSPDRDARGWREPWPHYGEEAAVRAWVRTQADVGTFGSGGEGAWTWACLDQVAYLGIRWLDDLGGSGSERSDRQRAEALLDQITTETLRACDARGWLLDVRFNGGGWDAVGLDIARRIEGERQIAWSTAQRNGPEHDDLTDFEDQWLEASEPGAFEGPVIVLTSPGTFSAGETMVLALRERSRVEVWGEPTSGHLSDLYFANLPKRGFHFTYSGDRYRAADGALYEGRGIPVDRAVPYEPGAASTSGDPQIRLAAEQLRTYSVP